MNCVLQQGWFSAEAADTLCHGFRAVSVGLHPSNVRRLRPTRAVRPAGGAAPAARAGAQREVLVRDNRRWGGDCGVGTGETRANVCNELRKFGGVSTETNKSGTLRKELNTVVLLDKFCFLII